MLDSVLVHHTTECVVLSSCQPRPCWILQSWLVGKAIQWFDPDAVALHTSQGYETRYSKLLLRLSVIASDVLGKPILKLDIATWLMHITPRWRHVLMPIR